MDHRLLQVELDRAGSWLKEDESITDGRIKLHLETLKDVKAELQSELGRQTRNALGHSIKSALTGDRLLKKLRDLQEVNNALDSLNLSRLSMRMKDSEATLHRLEEKIDTLIQQTDHTRSYQFPIQQTGHTRSYQSPIQQIGHARLNQSYIRAFPPPPPPPHPSLPNISFESPIKTVKTLVPTSDNHVHDSPWQESDKESPLQKLSALSIKGLDILAGVLECEDFLELSNRLRVWGIGVVDGPFAIEILKAALPGSSSPLPVIYSCSYTLRETFDIFTVPFVRILMNIEYIITRLQPNKPESLLFLQASEQVLRLITRRNIVAIPSMNHKPSASDGSDIAGEICRCTVSISNDIETLFERLPGLGSIRQTISLVRAQGRRSPRRPGGLKHSLPKETLKVAQALTHLLGEKAKEERSRKEKYLFEHMSRLFQGTTQRLARWANSQPATGDEMGNELFMLKSSLSAQIIELHNTELQRQGDNLSITLKDFQTRLDKLLALSKTPDDKKVKYPTSSDSDGTWSDSESMLQV